MGFFSNLADKVHISEERQYMGGHPDINKTCKGILTVNNDKIIFRGGMLSKFEIPIQEVTNNNLQTQEQISHNVTLTRLLAFGVFAFGMKKKKVDTTQYLVISYKENGIENSVVFQSNYVGGLASSIMKARQVYAKNNPEIEVQESEPVNNVQMEDIPTQIKKLADLKNQGVLTEDEFDKKKSELLARM